MITLGLVFFAGESSGRAGHRRAGMRATLALLFAAQACGPSGRSDQSLDVVIDTRGDTVSVFTNGPGAWTEPAKLAPILSIGEIEGQAEFLFGRVSSIAVDDSGSLYVLDGLAAEIRAFSPEGGFLRTYGGQGEGPGELMRPQAIAVLSDKRVLARDPRNRRVQIFGADESAEGEWTILNSSSGTSAPMWVDGEDRAYVSTRDQRQDAMASVPIVIIVAADGSVLDTIPLPTSGFQPPMLEARFESETVRRRSQSPVPFGPGAFWAVHPSGRLIRAISADYSVDLIHSDGSVLRMGRAREPIPVQAAEELPLNRGSRPECEEPIPTGSGTAPGFQMPSRPSNGFSRGETDGSGCGCRCRGSRSRTQTMIPPFPAPPRHFGERESRSTCSKRTGRTFGRVDAPLDFGLSPTPVFGEEDVWAVTRDELGVQRVVRYEMRRPSQ